MTVTRIPAVLFRTSSKAGPLTPLAAAERRPGRLREDRIQQQRFDVERGQCSVAKQVRAVRDDQRTVLRALGDTAVRAFDKGCIKRDDVHQCTETQLAQHETPTDRQLRRRYAGVEEQLDRI